MKGMKTNLIWDNLCLAPIPLAELKPMLIHGSARVALATELGLRIATLTRCRKITGRQARRVKNGFWECYESGKGFVKIENSCHIWLAP
jgi:hypothetical protein